MFCKMIEKMLDIAKKERAKQKKEDLKCQAIYDNLSLTDRNAYLGIVDRVEKKDFSFSLLFAPFRIIFLAAIFALVSWGIWRVDFVPVVKNLGAALFRAYPYLIFAAILLRLRHLYLSTKYRRTLLLKHDAATKSRRRN